MLGNRRGGLNRSLLSRIRNIYGSLKFSVEANERAREGYEGLWYRYELVEGIHDGTELFGVENNCVDRL